MPRLGSNTPLAPWVSGTLPLVDASVSSATYQQYRTAVHGFLRWWSSTDSVRSAVVSSSDDLDRVVVNYLHVLWSHGKGKQQGKNVLCGLVLFMPRFARRLPWSSRALRGWERLAPSVPHPPMSVTVLRVVALSMARLGWLSSGIGALLAFDCYLRVSELVSLRRSDVALPRDDRLGVDTGSSFVALRIRKTKRALNLWVTVKSPLARVLLLELLPGLGAEDKVFPFTAATFRRRLQRVCRLLGVAPYVPHSLRHGGATHDHLAGVSIEDIMARGRWASVRSARHYVQAGRALLLGNEVPPEVVALSAQLRTPRTLYDSMHLAAQQ